MIVNKKIQLSKNISAAHVKSISRFLRDVLESYPNSCNILIQDSLKKAVQLSEEYHLLNIKTYVLTNYSCEKELFSSEYLVDLINNYSVIILTKKIFNKLLIEHNNILSSKHVILHCTKSFSHNILEKYKMLFSGNNFNIVTYSNYSSFKKETFKEGKFTYASIESKYEELYTLASHYVGELNKVREDINKLPANIQKKHIDLGVKNSSRYITLGEDGMYCIDEQLLQNAVEEDHYNYLHGYGVHVYEEYCKYLGEEHVEYIFYKVDDTDSYRELRNEVKERLVDERKIVYDNVLNNEECTFEHLTPIYECTKNAVKYIKKTLQQFFKDQEEKSKEQTSILLQKADSSMYNIYKYTYQTYHELILKNNKQDHPILMFIHSYIKRCDNVTQEHAANILNKCYRHLKIYSKFYITPQRAKEIIEEFYEVEIEKRNGKIYFHLIHPIIA